MDPLSAFLSALVGGLSGASWVAASFVNLRTKQKVLHGSRREKVTAYTLRIGVVICCSVVIALGGRVMFAFTEATLTDAAVLIATLLGVIFLAKLKLLL